MSRANNSSEIREIKANPSGEIKCHICTRTFKRKATLRDHLKTQHSENASKVICPLCGGSYSNISNLNVHFKKHHATATITFNTSGQRCVDGKPIEWTNSQPATKQPEEVPRTKRPKRSLDQPEKVPRAKRLKRSLDQAIDELFKEYCDGEFL